jgi:ABC-type dipeptide/oligopeptide/nickel transport system permease subunit
LADPATGPLIEGLGVPGAERSLANEPRGGGPPLTPEGGDVQVIASGWKLALREFCQNRLGVGGVLIIVFFIVFCFLGPAVHHESTTVNVLNSDLPPGHGHLLGTDDNGLDELNQIMLGGQTALEIGFFSAAIATIIGTLYGAIAGLVGGVLDGLMMRFVDILLSIPFLLVVLILATKYHGTVFKLSVVLGIWTWLVPARLVRGEVLTLRVRDFVLAAKVMGAGTPRLVLRHLIPNALSVVIVNITFQVADAILALAYLGFLGFGLQFPQSSWGDMLGNAQQYVSSGYWWLVYPVGGCLVAVVLACNFIGDGLRDAVDVRLRRR